MTNTHTAGEQVQEEFLKTVRSSQSAVVEAIQTWARAVQSITPALPDVTVPLADKLPQPQELISSAYDFAEQLLASQRNFAESVLQVTMPESAKKNGTSAKRTQTSAK